MPSFEQGHLTTHPDALDVDWMAILPVGESMPSLVEPANMAKVEHDCGEPLIDVSEQFVCIETYRQAGWKHSHTGTFVRSGISDRLSEANASLPDGFALVLFDGWRALDLQEELFSAAYEEGSVPEGFLAPPNQERELPPPHVSGGTVDLTLSFDGIPLALGTTFDCFNEHSLTAAFEFADSPVRRLRRLLCQTMWAKDFIVYDSEWWHFEYGTPRWAAIRGVPGCYQRATLQDHVTPSQEALAP